MIDDLKPYPSMKDSGVEWLREVPEHWQVWRLKTSVHGCINGSGGMIRTAARTCLAYVSQTLIGPVCA